MCVVRYRDCVVLFDFHLESGLTRHFYSWSIVYVCTGSSFALHVCAICYKHTSYPRLPRKNDDIRLHRATDAYSLKDRGVATPK